MASPVLVLGASSGIGEACARTLSEQGRDVVLVARRAQRLEEVARKCGANACVFPYDLQDVDHIRTIFEFCRQKGAYLEGMVYCAGLEATYPIKGLNLEMMERVMRVNCLAFFEAGKWFSDRRYSADRSKIVAISSSASLTCDKGMGLYSASKAALNAAVKTMAKEYARRGILVNAVLPAGVMTPMALRIEKTKNDLEPAEFDLEAAIARLEDTPIPLDAEGEQPYGYIPPKSVASLVAYLLSGQNRCITGALVPVSAGMPL